MPGRETERLRRSWVGSRTLPLPCSRTSAWQCRNRWRRSSMSAEGQVSADARAQMVEWQLRRRGIEDERVLAAMGRVPRELFVPPHLRDGAYADAALPIGGDQTISQPYMVALICEQLALHGAGSVVGGADNARREDQAPKAPGERVLDVGTGSGYQ